jgi:hypothetical protein
MGEFASGLDAGRVCWTARDLLVYAMCCWAPRAVVFPSLVAGFTLLIGFVTLFEVPSAIQLLGLDVVLVGFRLTRETE